MNGHAKWMLGAAALLLAGGLAQADSAKIAQSVTPPAPNTPGAPAGPTSTPTTGPTVPATETPTAATTPLANVQNPRQAVVGAKVKDSKGEVVGEVKAVQLGPDGKVESVRVAAGTHTVILKSDSLAFAQADKTVVSKQTKEEIQALPPT